MQATETTFGKTLPATTFAPKFPRRFCLVALIWNGVGTTPERSVTPITQEAVLAIRRSALAE